MKFFVRQLTVSLQSRPHFSNDSSFFIAGDKKERPYTSPYSIFSKDDLEAKAVCFDILPWLSVLIFRYL